MSMILRWPVLAALLLFMSFWVSQLLAAGGSSIVARPRQAAYVSPNWPEGVADIVNDGARTTGWNDWFSEWPSDVNHYGYRIADMGEVNRLIKALASVKGELRQIRLSPRKEPRGLGWVTRLPEGNNIPVMFSIGDQKSVDEWFRRLPEGKFGVMQFESAPVAVPPTLTIFVQNEAIDLRQLEIPKGIDVSVGYCPKEFLRWNTVRESKREKQHDEQPETKADPTAADKATQDTIDQINEFLNRRAEQEIRKKQAEAK